MESESLTVFLYNLKGFRGKPLMIHFPFKILTLQETGRPDKSRAIIFLGIFGSARGRFTFWYEKSRGIIFFEQTKKQRKSTSQELCRMLLCVPNGQFYVKFH